MEFPFDESADNSNNNAGVIFSLQNDDNFAGWKASQVTAVGYIGTGEILYDYQVVLQGCTGDPSCL